VIDDCVDRPDEIYHVTVMPCYDKKLEASREDFFDKEYQTREVDCVVTTREMELMMKEKGWELRGGLREKKKKTEEISTIELPELLSHRGTSSGSYLHAIVEHVMTTSQETVKLGVKVMRNTDYEEYTVCDGGGKVVFKGIKCYGFRNLQNVVRKISRERGLGKGRRVVGCGEGKMDYVEVMACPGGCVNGGGQSGGQEVEAKYWEDEREEEAELAVQAAEQVAQEELWLRTEYRAVASEAAGLGAEW